MVLPAVDPGVSLTSQGIFFGVTFAIIPHANLTHEQIVKLVETLTSNGAIQIPLNTKTGRIQDIKPCSHIVSLNSDFPDYQSALDHFVAVVKPSWVDNSIIKGKQANPRQYSPDPALFMTDIVVCCADIPEGDKEAIVGAVLAMGGQHSGALTRMVTHLVALTMDNEKCDIARRKNLKCQIVLPHWFDDCLKLSRRIAEDPYTLPDPDILRVDPPPIRFHGNKHIEGALSPTPIKALTETIADQNSRRRLDVFDRKKIMLSPDLNISPRMESTLAELIVRGGGRIVTNVEDTDIFICQYRDGEDYVKASQAGKDVGNLSWLYHLITHNTWTYPMRRLLHYPVPRGGVPGFKSFRISVSNYVGDARIYLENLVKACGAEFTKTMRQDNTHLITAHLGSEKCEAAKEWNIHLVNHLWLEESYAQNELQTLTNPRYTHFPRGTHLGEIVGQTQIDRVSVEKQFFLQKNEEAAQHENCTSEQPRYENNTTAVATSSFVDPIDPNTKLKLAKPRGRAKATEEQSTPASIGSKRSRNQDLLQTPTASRFGEGKEDGTPTTTGSRGAKEKALSRLHELAPDMQLYAKEMKRVGGVIYGGRKVSDPDRMGGDKPRVKDRESSLRKRSVNEGEDMEDEIEGAQPQSKKAKGGIPPIQYRMMVTGDDRWVQNAKKEAADRQKLRSLGILLTQTPTEVNILCAPKVIRTRKFVSAIAAAPRLVSTKFLDECLKPSTKAIPAPTDYPFSDPEGEHRMEINMSEVVERAKRHRRKLLSGWTIFVTENVIGGPETFKDIVSANGGTVQVWKGRAGVTAQKTKKKSTDADGDVSMEGSRLGEDDEVVYLVTDVKDKKLWDSFKSTVLSEGLKPRIANPNWLLQVAMAQETRWDSVWEMK